MANKRTNSLAGTIRRGSVKHLIYEAMMAPRVHCSLGGRISLESDRFSPDLIEFLKEKGYRVDTREPFSFYLGAVHAVIRRENGGGFEGVAEIRRDGTAGGL